jgi:cytochrome P450
VTTTSPTTVRQPPGPPAHFFTGHLPEFRRDRLDFLTRCAREYGDFVSLRLGPKRVILVSDPEAIEYVLVTGSRLFRKHFALRLNPLVLGNGLLSSEGELWVRQRRLIQSAFQRQRIATYGSIMVEHADRMLAGWQEGQMRDIMEEMMGLTLGIAARTLFDAEVNDQADTVGAALRVAQESFLARFNSLLPIPPWVPTPANLRLKRAVRQLDDVIYSFIRQRRASGEDRSDLLSILLRARDEEQGTRMSDKQLRDEAMTLFLAGHETTALALAWTWALLAQHPEVEARLVEELHAVLGSRPPTVDDLPRLGYTEKVVLESMRLYPPAYTLGREALTECEVGGYRVPTGMTLLMSQWVVHRDPRYFDQPERFLPERWGAEQAKSLPRYAYFPFGGGPRLCIGSTFAMMEAVLALAAIGRKYRFTLKPGHPLVPWPTFTLRPQYGIQSVLARR